MISFSGPPLADRLFLPPKTPAIFRLTTGQEVLVELLPGTDFARLIGQGDEDLWRQQLQTPQADEAADRGLGGIEAGLVP